MPRHYTKNNNTKTAQIIDLATEGVPSIEIAKRLLVRSDTVHSILSRWRKRLRAEGKEVPTQQRRSRYASLGRAVEFPKAIADLQSGDTIVEVARRYDKSIPCITNWVRRHGDGWTVNEVGEFVPPEGEATYESLSHTPDVEQLSVLLNIKPAEVVKRAVALYKESIVKSLTNNTL